MATIVELVRIGKLFKFDPNLGPREQEFRVFLASHKLMAWMRDELPELGSTWKIEQTPAEQLDALLAIYAAGETLSFDHQFKQLYPRKDGVWEFKTADTRIFGWFPKKDCFIGVVANLTEFIKQHHLSHGYLGEVVRFRNALDLDEPKFISGENPNDVVSNFSIP